MARLTREQWADMRREWEASPTQGLTWLTKAAGGHWDITEEPIRRKRAQEGWQKPVNMGAVVRRAHSAADAASAARIAASPAPPVPEGDAGDDVGSDSPKNAGPTSADPRPADADGLARDLRTELLERHRKEWNAARAMLYRSMEIAKAATGFEAAKFSKITSETIKIIQEGEAKAWGLDALLIDFDAMSEEQLEQVVKHGRLPR
jgi:hypothetical protein